MKKQVFTSSCKCIEAAFKMKNLYIIALLSDMID